MNELMSFNNPEFGEIRTAEVDGEPWFVGRDVARALGYKDTVNALKSHVDEEDKRGGWQITTPSGEQEMTIINESGLYSLVLSSKLPGARKFKRWVTAEVLPAIRKTGGYQLPRDYLSALRALADAEEKRLSLEAENEANRPKVLFADAVSASSTSILVGDLAKLLRQNGMDIGQNRLFQRLRDDGYLIKGGERRNMPTQTAMDAGLFQIKETTISNADGSIRVTRTVKVTGKGQQHFITRYLGSRRPC